LNEQREYPGSDPKQEEDLREILNAVQMHTIAIGKKTSE
jgi:hypothetical protein